MQILMNNRKVFIIVIKKMTIIKKCNTLPLLDVFRQKLEGYLSGMFWILAIEFGLDKTFSISVILQSEPYCHRGASQGFKKIENSC